MSLDSVTRLFGARAALVDISFSIYPGEVFGLLGPNGAGKTTAISIISGLLLPNSGRVTVFGHDLARESMAARERMGVVPQEIAVYADLTALENLVFWGRLAGLKRGECRARAMELLEGMGLEKRAGDRVRDFSGGMKRRVNIACALMHDPDLLLLDEPTVGVDPQARERMMDWVRTWIGSDRAVLYTTHYLDEAERLCDRIAVIDNGRILACDCLPELVRSVNGHQLISLEGDYSGLTRDHEIFLSDHFQMVRRETASLVVTPKGGVEAVEAIRIILNSGLPVERIALQRAGLHEVFLHLTGKDLRE